MPSLRPHRWTRPMAAGVVASIVVACSSGERNDAVPTTSPTTAEPLVDVEVQGPVTGGRRGMSYNPMPEGLANAAGYVEEEYFVSGKAVSYASSTPPTSDGFWEVEPAGSAPYTTRILVRRPHDAAAFNGVVLVEWLNVTAGRDSDAEFGLLYPELLDNGYAYVGVSAQRLGVEGGEGRLEIPGVPADALLPLRQWDPERYAALEHPGDAYSYDIFSQIGLLVRGPGEVDPLDGLEVAHVIAAGESQSAWRMVTYIDAVHPMAGVFDGFLVHSRGASGTPLNDKTDGEAPAGTLIRNDVDVPVFQFQTETDLLGLGSVEARQPDDGNIVTWEVAGTAHADQATLDYGVASGQRWTSAGGFDANALCGQVNDGPQAAVVRAALDHLRAWVVEGDRPPSAPPIEIADGEIVRDDLGIAVGGVRTPAVDVPSVVLTGEGNPANVFCSLFGQTLPLPEEEVRARYASSDDYVAQVRAAADAAVDAGFLLERDAEEIVADARAVPIPD